MQSTYTDKAAGGIHTVAQAARELGVHADTIRRWADAGKMPFFRTPTGHRRFYGADIAAIRDGENAAAGAAPQSGSEVDIPPSAPLRPRPS